MVLCHKSQDLSIGFVYGDATAHEPLGDDDFGPPGPAAVFASPQLDTAPERQQGAIQGHDDIGEPAAGVHRLDIELRLAEKRFQLAFGRMARGRQAPVFARCFGDNQCQATCNRRNGDKAPLDAPGGKRPARFSQRVHHFSLLSGPPR